MGPLRHQQEYIPGAWGPGRKVSFAGCAGVVYSRSIAFALGSGLLDGQSDISPHSGGGGWGGDLCTGTYLSSPGEVSTSMACRPQK